MLRPAGATIDIPDRPTSDPRNLHHGAAVFEHDVGIRFNGLEHKGEERSGVGAGWIMVPTGQTVDRQARPSLITLNGALEAPCRQPW